jgi:hypothetical protein
MNPSPVDLRICAGCGEKTFLARFYTLCETCRFVGQPVGCGRCGRSNTGALQITCYEEDEQGVWRRHPGCAIWSGGAS